MLMMPNREKIIEFVRNNYVIIIILLLAFAVRWYGIYFDYPYGVESIGDESVITRYMMDVINGKSIFAGTSSYPVLMAFFYFPVLVLRVMYLAVINGIYNVSEIEGFIIGHGIGQIFVIIRWFSVVLGTASVYLVYRIYSLVFKYKQSAYYAALVYALSLIPVVLSHWGKMHVPMAFFLLVSLLFVLKFEIERNEKFFFWSVIAAAASVSCHYIGVMAFTFPTLCLMYNFRDVSRRTIAKAILIGLLIIGLGFGVNYRGITSMVVGVYDGFLKPNNFTGLFPISPLERLYFGLVDVFRIEPIFFVLFVLMFVMNFKKYLKDRLIRYISAGLLVSYVLLVGVAGAHLSRWLLVFITFSITLAAGNFVEYLNDKGLGRGIIITGMFLLILPNAYFVGRWLSLFRDNTRAELVQWVQDNVKEGEFIYTFDNWLGAPLSYEALALEKKLYNTSAKKQDYILAHPEVLNGVNDVNLLHAYSVQQNLGVVEGKIKYMSFLYWMSGEKADYYEFPSKKNTYGLINQMKKNYDMKLIKTMSPVSDRKMMREGVDDYFNSPHSWRDLLYLERGGPFIEIYEVSKK